MQLKSYSQFTWHKHSPAPFESAWCVFAKILALNHTKPKDIFDLLSNYSNKSKKILSTIDSSWVDFDKFAFALSSKTNILKSCFLDQLGFSIESLPEVKSIRICRECLAKGYHCIFFCLPLINECPWHRCKLEYPCKECFKSVLVKGLTRKDNIGHNPSENEFDSTGINRTYKSSCGHIAFSEKFLNNLSSFNEVEKRVIEFKCNQFLKWWYEVNRSDHHLSIFARQIFTKNSSAIEVEKYISIATQIAGPCPWNLNAKSLPFHYAYWKPGVTEAAEHCGFKGSLYAKVYKSIRRYIFNRYIRKHKACLNELLKLETYQEQYLSSSSICSFVIAYVTWRVNIERFSRFELIRGKSISRFRLDYQIFSLKSKNLQGQVVDIASAAQFCIASFFMTLDSIERLLDYGSFNIYNWNISYIGGEDVMGIFHEFLNSDENEAEKLACKKKLIIYTCQKFLINRATTRCVGRINQSSLEKDHYMVGSRSLWNYSYKKNVLFRVVNIAKDRKNPENSFSFIEAKYFI